MVVCRRRLCATVPITMWLCCSHPNRWISTILSWLQRRSLHMRWLGKVSSRRLCRKRCSNIWTSSLRSGSRAFECSLMRMDVQWYANLQRLFVPRITHDPVHKRTKKSLLSYFETRNLLVTRVKEGRKVTDVLPIGDNEPYWIIAILIKVAAWEVTEVVPKQLLTAMHLFLARSATLPLRHQPRSYVCTPVPSRPHSDTNRSIFKSQSGLGLVRSEHAYRRKGMKPH